jgi:hypothetical protein
MLSPLFLVNLFVLHIAASSSPPNKRQIPQNPLAAQISAVCNEQFVPSTLPELLPAIQSAAADVGSINFT